MDLLFDKKLAENYTSQSQKIRVITESWVNRQVYCPNCGQVDVGKYGNNRPVADFFCTNCKEEYELKSKQDPNHHIKDKIRQQLQVLRDKGYLEFINKGTYRRK
jgi:transposase-like protein